MINHIFISFSAVQIYELSYIPSLPLSSRSFISSYLFTESQVLTEKSQTETLPYSSKIARSIRQGLGLRFSPFEVNKLFIGLASLFLRCVLHENARHAPVCRALAVFSNARRVLSQCNFRRRLLYLLNVFMCITQCPPLHVGFY